MSATHAASVLGEAKPTPAIRPVVTRAKEASASALFSAAAYVLLARLRAHEAGARAGKDPEHLHQMRVALRRLRATLSLYSGLLGRRHQKIVARELKWLARALGPARDSDVFINDIWPPLCEVLGGGPLIEALQAKWLKQRRRNARVAQRALASRRYRRMLHRLERWFSTQSMRDHADAGALDAWNRQVRDFARRELARRSARVRSYVRAPDARDADALHRLRIHIKKLRYVMDALGPLFKAARVKTTLAALSRLQDILGAMNDVAVATQKMDAALPRASRIDLDQLRGRIAAWQTLRSNALKRRLDIAWRAYRHVKTFW